MVLAHSTSQFSDRSSCCSLCVCKIEMHTHTAAVCEDGGSPEEVLRVEEPASWLGRCQSSPLWLNWSIAGVVESPWLQTKDRFHEKPSTKSYSQRCKLAFRDPHQPSRIKHSSRDLQHNSATSEFMGKKISIRVSTRRIEVFYMPYRSSQQVHFNALLPSCTCSPFPYSSTTLFSCQK